MTDRESHRAAVEAGYASLAEYIKKWGDDKMSVFDMGLTHENLKKLCDAIDEQADEIERLREELLLSDARRLNAGHTINVAGLDVHKENAKMRDALLQIYLESKDPKIADIARSTLQQKDSE